MPAIPEHPSKRLIAADPEEDERLRSQLGDRLVQWRDGVVSNQVRLHGVRRALDVQHPSRDLIIGAEHDAHGTVLSDVGCTLVVLPCAAETALAR